VTKAKPKAKAAPKAAKATDTLRVYVYRPILHCPTCNLGMEYVDKSDVDPMVCICKVCKTAVQLPRPTMDVTPVKYPIDGPADPPKVKHKLDVAWDKP
jgi:hypothetical protein